MQISDEHLRGRTVIAADGQAIGEVAALFIDTSTWTISRSRPN
jgi:sporulation protein YlmC with PRC-barrel domain